MKHDSFEHLKKKLVSLRRWNKVVLMIAADGIVLPFCLVGALLLSLDHFSLTRDSFAGYGYYTFFFVPLVTITVFATCGLYDAVIRFIDKHLLIRAGGGLAAVVVLSWLLAFLFSDVLHPRNALMAYWFIAFSYVVSSRLAVRSFLRNSPGYDVLQRKMVGIFGAGEAGAQLALAMRSEGQYRPVCFFDDKQELHNRSVAGLKVFHTHRLADLAGSLGIRMIVLAIPSAPPRRRRQIIHALSGMGITIKTLNNLIALADDGIGPNSVRDIKIEDLLGRNPVPPEPHLFSRCIRGCNVLVTGAGGSIGSELCRQIASLQPQRLHLLDHSEFALYSIEHELRTRFPQTPISVHLGSVCDARTMERVMERGRIDTVYHAAAYKHVPIVEANMVEGIRNNVLGAQVVAAAAKQFRVKTCVLVSTDKAVRPTSIMGATKRIGELVFQAAAKSSEGATTFCMVRLGNVLASSGSVIPVFQEQIRSGGPITITHPDIIRYFMLIPEAAQLVIQAGAMAEGGDVFVLDMGEPVRIVDLARTMIEMSGLEEKSDMNPDGEIEIRYIGLRPGEKLYEELLIGNNVFPTRHPRILGATEASIHHALLDRMIDRLLAACACNDPELIKATVKSIVPEYVPPQNASSMQVDEAQDIATRQFRYRRIEEHQRCDAFAVMHRSRTAQRRTAVFRRTVVQRIAASMH